MRENDEEYSDFDDSESDESEEDGNYAYSYPNDRCGRVFGELPSDVEVDAIGTIVNNNHDLNNRERMQIDEAPTIVFIDEQDVVNVRQAIVEDEDHESDEESDESVEVQPRTSKPPRRAVTQNTQHPGGQPAQICLGPRSC